MHALKQSNKVYPKIMTAYTIWTKFGLATIKWTDLSTVKTNLYNLKLFHTDRGSEFKNYLIDDLLKKFGIIRSLSAKGCPYDNAVAEVQFKIMKTEFVRSRHFENLQHLRQELQPMFTGLTIREFMAALDIKAQSNSGNLSFDFLSNKVLPFQ